MTGYEKELSGWGRYPRQVCRVYRPDTAEQIRELLAGAGVPPMIAFGMGRSYGDAPLNLHRSVVMTGRMNRMLRFEEHTGLLECEAGVTLEEIIRVFLPRGFFLPVTPGTKYITVGGAIANDVHGKNHHRDGCFSEHVESFRLLTADGSILRCSRTENADVFRATIGGIGLTGIILSVELKLMRVASAYVRVKYETANHVEEAFRLFQDDDRYQYSVAWIDCLARGRSLGRSILMRGNHASREELERCGSGAQHPFDVRPRRQWRVPFELPGQVLNPWSIRLFNEAYYVMHARKKEEIVDYDRFFYPLDAVLHWNRAYGPNGFVQYQAVLPDAHAFDGIVGLLESFSSSRRSSFLAVLKRMGKANDGLLSFPMRGYTLALDMPLRGEGLLPMLRKLDEFVLSRGGRIYLGKDAILSAEHFREMYPSHDRFRSILRGLDPNQRFSSSMSRRLQLTET